MNASEIMAELQALGSQANQEGMARFGIQTQHALGIAVPTLRQLARRIGKRQHTLAQELWDTGVHEARLLASMIDDPQAVTREQMERWAAEFDSWDLCDQCCGNLFAQTSAAWEMAVAWSAREQEYVKRASFALMAYLATHDKQASDERYLPYLAIIQREAGDDRNFVKKAVNWALRQIGKRNAALNQAAIVTAQEILAQGGKGRWVASDALRELTSAKVQSRLASERRDTTGR